MKQHLLITTTAAIVGLGLAGCDQSVLDLQPRTELAEDAVFADVSLAEAFLAEIYRGLGDGFTSHLSVLGGEDHFVHSSIAVYAESNRSPSATGGLPGEYQWDNTYADVRNANVFLARLADAEFDEDTKQSMEAQARFLRAFFYHRLLRLHGGVPIITQPYGLDDEFEVARNSFEETVAFIVDEVDAVAGMLPVEVDASELGRVTRGAALALKSRVLLHAASDLYVENPSGMAETGYTGAVDQTALWTAAKDAAQDVMDLGVYGLFRPDPASPEEAANNVYELWIEKTHEEKILSRYWLISQPGTPWIGRSQGPNGYHTWGGWTPTQDFVDNFRMLDGSEFDWDNPAHAAAPYENRDPRLRGSVLYEGVPLRPRPAGVQAQDPVGIIQTFRWLTLPDGTQVPGLDTRNGPVEDWNGSHTGYYRRKGIDDTVVAQFNRQDVPWIFIRYAEILLNYAEASTELGDLGDAEGALNQIKRRAGMPEVAGLTQAELREEYRHEREIELAFEEHRVVDVRRWMTAPDVLNRDGMAIDIYIDADDAVDRSTWTYTSYEPRFLFDRQWEDHFYFWPISRDEINRNSLLVQNPGYD